MEKKQSYTKTKESTIDSSEKKINLLKTQLAKEKTKSKKYDEYRVLIELMENNTSASYSLLHVARSLNIGRSHLCLVLRDDEVFLYDDGINYAYQYYIDKGYFITTTKITQAGFSVPVIRVTNKGLAWILKKYNHLKKKRKPKVTEKKSKIATRNLSKSTKPKVRGDKEKLRK